MSGLLKPLRNTVVKAELRLFYLCCQVQVSKRVKGKNQRERERKIGGNSAVIVVSWYKRIDNPELAFAFTHCTKSH